MLACGGQTRQLGCQKAVAFADFGGFRLVGGRQAFHRVGDAAADELQAIVGGYRLRRAGVAKPVQGLVQQYPGMVAGERASAAVGAVHARCEADDQQGRCRVAKRRHRARVVIGMLRAHLVEKVGEAWTGPAVRIKTGGVDGVGHTKYLIQEA